MFSKQTRTDRSLTRRLLDRPPFLVANGDSLSSSSSLITCFCNNNRETSTEDLETYTEIHLLRYVVRDNYSVFVAIYTPQHW